MMKIRKGFVTNSSSSSFVIAKKYLDRDQMEAIRDHRELGEKLNMDCFEYAWDIRENKYFIGGYTDMDNFSMDEFLRAIDVDMRIVDWDDSYYFELPEDYIDWRSLL